VSTQLTDEVENKEKREMIKRIVNIKCEKSNTSSEWLHHPPSPQGEGK
jgi:hypothetical protein